MDEANRLHVGAKLVVSTSEGEEEDEVTRVLVHGMEAGVWIVETARNGRVIVLRGRGERHPLSAERHGEERGVGW
jgi:hypothetical protein